MDEFCMCARTHANNRIYVSTSVFGPFVIAKGLLFIWPFFYWPIMKCNETEMESVGCDGPVTMTAFNAGWFPSVEYTHALHVLKWRFSNVTTHYWPFIILSSICEKKYVCVPWSETEPNQTGEKKNRKRNMETAVKPFRTNYVTREYLVWHYFHFCSIFCGKLKLSTHSSELPFDVLRLNIHTKWITVLMPALHQTVKTKKS